MSRASIYAHPARYEPFGLSVLEAALSECALVLGDINALRENWSGAARRRAQLFSPQLHRDAYYNLYLEMLEARVNSATRRAAAPS